MVMENIRDFQGLESHGIHFLEYLKSWKLLRHFIVKPVNKSDQIQLITLNWNGS